jgi:hypothetical protein
MPSAAVSYYDAEAADKKYCNHFFMAGSWNEEKKINNKRQMYRCWCHGLLHEYQMSDYLNQCDQVISKNMVPRTPRTDVKVFKATIMMHWGRIFADAYRMPLCSKH